MSLKKLKVSYQDFAKDKKVKIIKAEMLKIKKELVQKMIKNQFPEYAHLKICQVKKSGHDNRTFRLGDKMTIRLPSGENYASQVEKELF